jgi:hypothetical protein
VSSSTCDQAGDVPGRDAIERAVDDDVLGGAVGLEPQPDSVEDLAALLAAEVDRDELDQRHLQLAVIPAKQSEELVSFEHRHRRDTSAAPSVPSTIELPGALASSAEQIDVTICVTGSVAVHRSSRVRASRCVRA